MRRLQAVFCSNAVVLLAGVFLAYSLFTLAMTWPVVAQLNTRLIGTGDDMWVHYWNDWRIKQILQQGGDIYYTPLLFHPTGVSLLHHNLAWVNIATWLFLEPIVGSFAAYNLVHLLHIPLCGLTMFLLGRRLFKLDGIAFLSGLVFAFWPYRITDVNHPNMISTEVFPLFMLFLLRLFRDGRQIRDGVIAGVLLALIGYMRWQLAILAGFMACLYVLYTLVWERGQWGWRTLAGLMVVVGVSVVLVAPAVYPLVRADLAGGFSDETYEMQLGSSQDLLNWLVPQQQHPLRDLYNRVFANYAGIPEGDRNSAFLGHIVLVLAGVGTVKRWKETRFWFILAAVCFLLALGPHLQFNGDHYVNISLPIRLIDWALPVRMLRYPHRFTALLALPVAALAGFGALVLRGWLARRQWGKRIARPAIFGTLSGLLILADYVSIPTATVSTHVPDFYLDLASEAGDFAIVELPGRRHDAAPYMFYQTAHGHPLQTGHISRVPSEALDFISSVPVLSMTYEEGTLNTKPPDISRQLAMLADAGFRYIVVHKDTITPEQLVQWRFYLVISPYYEDDEVLVYSTTHVVGEDCPLLHDLGMGLWMVEVGLSTEGVRPGDVLAVEVVWGTTASPGADFQVEMALVDEKGDAGQAERFALSPGWPADEWPENTIARARYSLVVDRWLDGGTYSVVLGLVQDGRPVGQGVEAGKVEVQLPERGFAVPVMAQEVGATFGGDLCLLGYDLEVEAGSLHVTLHWQALRRMDVSYTMFVHVFDPATGEIVSQADVVPYGYTYPTAWWEAGEVLSDEVTVSLEEVLPGTYGLAVGVYNADTGERLAISGQPSSFAVDDRRLFLPEEIAH
ncbi:MAG: hypothetical protein JW918_10330 [Anaerolineae bacterium]|nr:hypothetical protein [Anaerolineae bacterium]